MSKQLEQCTNSKRTLNILKPQGTNIQYVKQLKLSEAPNLIAEI